MNLRIFAYLVFILIALAVAGAVDLSEAERLSIHTAGKD